MSDETLIADLVRAGVSDDLIGRVARLILSRARHVTSRDKIAERREKDKVRQQKRRQKIKETKGLAKANDVATVPSLSRDGHVTGVSERCKLKNLSVLSSLVETKKDQQVRTEYVDGQKSKRGARILPDWRPSQSVVEWCRRLGVVGAQFEIFLEEFIDYWIAVPGQRGCKLNWDATFRNRVRQKVPANAARALPAVNEPAFKQPPPEFLERERQRNAAKATSVRSDATVGRNGKGHEGELPLQGGGLLRPEVGGAPGDAPHGHQRK
jgi:hypothetical protein